PPPIDGGNHAEVHDWYHSTVDLIDDAVQVSHISPQHLNVRSGPGTSFQVTMTLSEGQEFAEQPHPSRCVLEPISKTTRKPMHSSRLTGVSPFREADRVSPGLSFHEPPRTARRSPVAGPWGSIEGPFW